jgi:hypothetical protein
MKEQAAWVKMNVDFKGFYRVHYDDANWDALIEQLKTDHTVSIFALSMIIGL